MIMNAFLPILFNNTVSMLMSMYISQYQILSQALYTMKLTGYNALLKSVFVKK